MIGRREFISLLGGAAAIWPLAAHGQQAAMPVIGFLHAGSLDGYANHVVAFRQGLKEAGFVPNQNVAIEYRWAAGQYGRLPALASELTGRQVAVLVAGGGGLSVRAARTATTTIPIVFTTGADPVQTGLVSSLRRPEGNSPASALPVAPWHLKRLELIRELLPKATAIAVLQNSENPIRPRGNGGIGCSCCSPWTTTAPIVGQHRSRIETFVQLGQQRPDALLLYGDLFFTGQRDLIIALAARHRIPTIYHAEEFTRAGGLISYGASPAAAYRQAGIYTGRILNGAKPADLPVLLPTKFDLVLDPGPPRRSS